MKRIDDDRRTRQQLVDEIMQRLDPELAEKVADLISRRPEILDLPVFDADA